MFLTGSEICLGIFMTINLEIIEKIEAPRSTSSLIVHQDAIEQLERAINKNKLRLANEYQYQYILYTY